jgi:outer membrane lipoprotein SlyB
MRTVFLSLLTALLALSLGLGGCAPKIGGGQYGSGGTRSTQSVSYGTIQSIRIVEVEDSGEGKTLLGTAGGAVVGGVLGSLLGGGRGRTLATVGGALAGAAGGYAGSKLLTGQEAYEIMVQLDNGQTISVVQGMDYEFSSGQRVRVLSGGDGTRVAPM